MNDIKKYFENLGYIVDWDFSRTLREEWWEIIHPNTNRLICQIDKHPSLESVIEDLICLRENRETTSKENYKINAPNSKEFDELLEKIKL